MLQHANAENITELQLYSARLNQKCNAHLWFFDSWQIFFLRTVLALPCIFFFFLVLDPSLCNIYPICSYTDAC